MNFTSAAVGARDGQVVVRLRTGQGGRPPELVLGPDVAEQLAVQLAAWSVEARNGNGESNTSPDNAFAPPDARAFALVEACRRPDCRTPHDRVTVTVKGGAVVDAVCGRCSWEERQKGGAGLRDPVCKSPPRQVACGECGDTFQTWSRTARYCPACRT